jgi:hypothetical protein
MQGLGRAQGGPAEGEVNLARNYYLPRNPSAVIHFNVWAHSGSVII